MPSDYVTAMLFDKKGYFWIGTDKGLCRYDGRNLDILTTDEGLVTNLVYSIHEADDGAIWITGSGGGFSRISSKVNRLKVDTSFYWHGVLVQQVWQGPKGHWWISAKDSSSGKIFLFNTTNLLKKNSPLCFSTKLNGNMVPDKTGRLWYDSSAEITWLDPLAREKALPVPKMDNDSIVLRRSGNKILSSGSKSCWIYEAGKPDNPARLALPPGVMLNGSTQFFSSDKMDILYRGLSGALIYKKNILEKYIRQPDKLEDVYFFSVTGDDFGNIYFSRFGDGIFIRQSDYLKLYPTGESTRRIAFAEEQTFFNSKQAVYSIESTGITGLKKRKIPGIREINFCTTGPGNKLLVAGYGWLKNELGVPVSTVDQRIRDLGDVQVYKNAFIISSYSFGIHKIENDRLDSAWSEKIGINGPLSERIKIIGDSLYIMTLRSGLHVKNMETGSGYNLTMKNGLLSNSVFDVCSINKELWIGTLHGAGRWNGRDITIFGHQEGFKGNRTLSIFQDRQNRTWVLSDSCLHLYFKNRLWPIRSYPVLLNNNWYLTTAKYNPVTNTLWMGCNIGLLEVDMDHVVPNTKSYPVFLRQINAGSQLFDSALSTITLPWNHQPLTIEIASHQYSEYTRPEIYVRLTGLDTGWIPLNASGKWQPGSLAPGQYRLEYKTIGPDMGGVEAKTLLMIKVKLPWFKNPWFFGAVIVAATALAWYQSRKMVKRQYQQKLNEARAEKALQDERSRISRELHDNVGSMLTLMINQMEDSEALKHEHPLKNPTTIARKTLSQLRDAIWALDSKQLTTSEWTSRTRQYLQAIAGNGIIIHENFEWPENQNLSPIAALNTFRIVQEACNNILKHARATEITINTRTSNTGFEILLKDNGTGFDATKIKPGFGLKNMKKRMTELDGTFTMEGWPGKGTVILISWPAKVK